MDKTSRLEQQDALRTGFLFTAFSIDLGRFGGYDNPARNAMDPAVHLNWTQAVNHRLMVTWDLIEKYGLQLSHII